VRDGDAVGEAVRATAPEAIFHLAGLTDESRLAALIEVNVLGALRVIEAASRLAPPASVLLVGSAAVYPDLPDSAPCLDEDTPPRPATVFGLSRHAALEVGRIAAERRGLPVFLCRPFNLIGPGLSERFAPAAIAREALDLRRTGGRTLRVRNAGCVRDFVDVRDAVRAYLLIVERGRPSVPYNVCSGRGVSIRELAALLAEAAGVVAEIAESAANGQPSRSVVRRSVGCRERLRRDTGWTPAIPLRQSAADLVASLAQR
jgi:GDP-4-dehydro-6-deoxy-D-mannose reductase